MIIWLVSLPAVLAVITVGVGTLDGKSVGVRVGLGMSVCVGVRVGMGVAVQSAPAVAQQFILVAHTAR